ncbi:helix-turn-helix domain-containing protein [Chloroflexota bacterium]
MENQSEVLTVAEVAEYLKLSKSKVYRMIQIGQMPHIRIGKNVRLTSKQLEAWLEQNTVEPPVETHLCFPILEANMH